METINGFSKIFFICILVIASIFLYRGFTADAKIKSDHKVIVGIITNIKYSKGWLIDYEYTLGFKKIKAAGSCTVKTMQNFKSGNDKILIVFQSTDPTNSELLETKRDFEKYNIVISDTTGISCLKSGVEIQK
jgi:hypothetical protein